MVHYVARRLGQGILVLWGVTLVVFLIIHLVPGNPARQVLGPYAAPAAVRHLDHQLGLDKSLPEQYIAYMTGLLQGQLGESISAHTSVASLIGPRILPSVGLVVYAMLISLIVATPLAALSALTANRAPDHAVRIGAVIWYALPSFWFGLMLAVVFGLEFHVLPTSGFDASFPGGMLETLSLPAITTALITTPVIMRVMRSSMIETLQSEAVVAARARGLAGMRAFRRYVLRNSLTSTVTFTAIAVATLLSFSVVVEQVFAIPGLGTLLVTSVLARDYPTVQGLTIVFATAVVVANLVADLMYAVLDPRVRL